MALAGVRVIELAGLAPAPFCGMILSDFGARVIRIDRTKVSMAMDSQARGKQSVALNLKSPQGVVVLKKLCLQSDVVLEPFRKGLLSMLGRSSEKPYAPLNLVADFAGGGLMCALGIVLALLERSKSGQGQIVDASMVEGAAYVGSFMWKSRSLGLWNRPRGENMLDSGAPFYDTYQTSDGKHVAVGAIEPQFYDQLIRGLGLDAASLPPQMSISDWPELRQTFHRVFAQKTQAEWSRIFDGTDACVTPVLPLDEAGSHPHNRERGSFLKDAQGEVSPRPAPVLSRTPAQPCLSRDPVVGENTRSVMEEYGFDPAHIEQLLSAGVVECNETKARL
ncbi:alpha-methylacyl-CoA racemase isoform X2 [Tachysurus fulvidraco]|uniref:alpha-methylacyl-CoA racemase isoform X2 n=1 Tax=Tachysurus fulvidraco TaxID=1234273 RepID=UPI001FF07D44|nr:alpha-methylacyl-CoA racemase isoform X2 [Tachysurus fulvidraco]